MKKIGQIVKQQEENNRSSNLPEKQEWLDNKKQEIIAAHGNIKEFGIRFNPDIQIAAASNLERSFFGEAPTLRQLEYAYGIKGVRAWFSIQLENLNKFTGVSNKMTFEQMQMLTDVIVTKAPYLKASEILVFFHKFKSGDLGEFYGNVDPLKLTGAFGQFLAWRSTEIDKIKTRRDAERRDRGREESFKNAITREEYERMKDENKADKQETSEG
ncbi:MAG TPA: DUF6633 family protein [Thermoclostridium sp.]|nr:DUF6633 family protein [Thermoclostridium sp.]